MEIEELGKSISKAEEEIQICRGAIVDFESEMGNLELAIAQAREVVSTAKNEVKVQKEAMQKNNKDINSLGAKQERLAKENKEKELLIQELNHKIEKASGDAKEASKKIDYMIKQFEWISVDRRFFGEAGSAYDFNAQDMNEAKKKINKLENNKEKLERTVNTKAMSMLDKAEHQYNDLMRKKATVEMDKAKIKNVIEELDRKKKDELRSAWDKVNKDFGSIFSTLLPGTSAKLQPPEGMDVLDGLEVRENKTFSLFHRLFSY